MQEVIQVETLILRVIQEQSPWFLFQILTVCPPRQKNSKIKPPSSYLLQISRQTATFRVKLTQYLKKRPLNRNRNRNTMEARNTSRVSCFVTFNDSQEKLLHSNLASVREQKVVYTRIANKERESRWGCLFLF